MTKGIDVSTFQGKINWKKVKMDFVIIRGGYGRYNLDEQFKNNYNGCKKNKIPCGVYHYSYADTTAKAKQEADFVISYLKGKQLEYPIAYDVEDKTQSKLSKQELTDIARVFLERVQKAGYYVVLYSSKAWLDTKFDMKQLKGFDVWVAQWNSKCTYNGDYGMWQYTDKRSITGINGYVDGDYALKDYPSIIKERHLNGFKKPTTTTNKYVKGNAIKLKNTPIYASASTMTASGKKTGTYYIYDGEKVNGRYRITISKNLCGKKPESLNVTGWVKGE